MGKLEGEPEYEDLSKVDRLEAFEDYIKYTLFHPPLSLMQCHATVLLCSCCRTHTPLNADASRSVYQGHFPRFLGKKGLHLIVT